MSLSLLSPRSLSGLLLALTLASATPLAAQTTPPAPSQPNAQAAEVPAGAHREADGTIVLKSGRRIPPPLYLGETSEERMKRIGMREDPGLDPDPEKLWSRYGKQYKILKFDRIQSSYDGLIPGWVRPMWAVNIEKEIYREDEKNVWVWMEIFELPTPEELGLVKVDGEQSQTYVEYTEEQLGFVRQLRDEMREIAVPQSPKTLKFRNSSEGLPTTGSWRNGLAVADMNEDGRADLIVPPPRGGGGGTPVIFLGDGKGGWKHWPVKWPLGINYGSAAAGDLDRDGHADLVFGVHLYGVVVFLGDGKGNFTQANDGLPKDFPTRRADLVDMDEDGDLDIVVITEGPTLSREQVEGSPLRIYLNDGKARWTEMVVADPLRDVAGDWVAAGDFNGDRKLDLVGASVIFHGTDLFYLRDGKGWKPEGRGWLPFYSYYSDLAAGQFSSRKRDDAILSFSRVFPNMADPRVVTAPEIPRIVGLERVWFEKGRPKREPIMQWAGDGPVWGLSDGDLDGDGHRDVIFWRPRPHEFVLLLGDGKGGFKRAAIEGLVSPELPLYDIKVADVNGDRRQDVIVMWEKNDENPGSVQVFLNEGATTAGK